MIVLGICDGHDSGACLVKDGKVAAAVSEERLSEKKRQPGFPSRAIDWCLLSTSTKPETVDRICVAEKTGRGAHRLLNKWYEKTDPNLTMHRGMNLISMKVQNYIAQTRGLSNLDSSLSQTLYQSRFEKLGFIAPLILMDHHLAHALSAAKSSGFDRALVVTQDAFGDGVSGTVYKWVDGKLERLHFVPYPHSPALLYGLVTSYLGFEEGDEGKVAGLAATGNAKHTQWLFEYFLKSSKRGFYLNSFPTLQRLKKLFADTSSKDIAAGLQSYVENLVAHYIQIWMKKTGMKNLCLAGGLFANVRLNQVVAEHCNCDDLFVFPHMGDGGLCAGAAMDENFSPASFDPFIGPDIETSEVENAASISPETIETIAKALAEGGVIGIAKGPMEFGPRALGNRSLLFSATEPELAERVNKAIGRPDMMPFAPVVRDCDWEVITKTPPWKAFSYMTCTTDCMPGVEKQFPTAVHTDGSMRLQLAEKDTTPMFYDILSAYGRYVSPPLLINTSFNRHEKPILNDANEALRLFEEIPLHGLVLGNQYLR